MKNKWDAIVPNKSLVELLDESFARNADKDCVCQGDETLTYREVYDQSVELAGALVASGLKKGFRAAVLSPNNLNAVPAIIGIIRAGGIWLPVNPRNSLTDNLVLLQRFNCSALLVHSEFANFSSQLRADLPALKVFVGLDSGFDSIPNWREWANQLDLDVGFPEAEPTDIVSMPMTGGTTGEPKAVGLSNRNFAGILTGMIHVMPDDGPSCCLAASPMTHVGGRIVLSVIHRGGRSVILPKVDPQTILKTIDTEKITEFFLPPSAIYALLDQPNVREFDFSSLRSIGYGSAPMSIARLKLALKTFGPVMQGGFGQTECPMLIASLPSSEHFVDGRIAPDERLRSCGRATAVSELAILDDSGELLGPMERGEIGVKGPMVMEGYVENEKATAKTRQNGWHLTGDIGYLDNDGYLYIVDRKKDMIITGGFNVYSVEVEGVITAMDGVKECSVIGVPDDKWGEAVKAVVKREDDSTVSEEYIIAHCKEMLGGVKAPKSVDFVDDFPRSSIGKIMKRELRDIYWNDKEEKV